MLRLSSDFGKRENVAAVHRDDSRICITPPIVIASHRVGAARRPTTGSAKQSIATIKNGLLRR
jgi:hypothetical protein